MKNKKFFLSLAAFLISLSSFAGPRYDPNEPDLPLPHGSEVGIGLLVAIVVLPIGYFIFKSNDSSNSSDISDSKGCVGIILYVIGFIGLIPLLFWICEIGKALLGIAFVVVLVIGLIAWLFGKK